MRPGRIRRAHERRQLFRVDRDLRTRTLQLNGRRQANGSRADDANLAFTRRQCFLRDERAVAPRQRPAAAAVPVAVTTVLSPIFSTSSRGP